MSKQTDKLILFNWSGAIEDDTYTGESSYRKKCLELLRFFESDIFTKFSDTYIFHYWSLHLEETMYLNASMPTSFEWFHSVSNDFKQEL